jgi:heat shock protein HtpX
VLAALSWGLVFASIYKWNEDADIAGSLQVWASLAMGAAAAGLVVGSKLWRAQARTLRALGAVDIAEGDVAMLDNLLAGLAIAAGAHPVSAALVADDAPNAMAVGASPKRTTIVVTSGLLEKCTRYELEAVLAVEVCSVRRLDTALHTIGLACAQATIANHHSHREDAKDPRSWVWIILTYPSMVIAELIRAAAFNVCDFGADDMAIKLTRNPQALADVLDRLDADKSEVRVLSPGTAPLWFEPIPRHDPERAAEFRRFGQTPTLAERRARLPHVSPAP